MPPPRDKNGWQFTICAWEGVHNTSSNLLQSLGHDKTNNWPMPTFLGMTLQMQHWDKWQLKIEFAVKEPIPSWLCCSWCWFSSQRERANTLLGTSLSWFSLHKLFMILLSPFPSLIKLFHWVKYIYLNHKFVDNKVWNEQPHFSRRFGLLPSSRLCRFT